jgi:hypothetical protein
MFRQAKTLLRIRARKFAQLLPHDMSKTMLPAKNGTSVKRRSIMGKAVTGVSTSSRGALEPMLAQSVVACSWTE